MALFFLQESKQKNKCKIIVNNFLNKIEERKEGHIVFLELPIKTCDKIKDKKIKRIVKKIEMYNIKTMLLSERLYRIEGLKIGLQAKNIKILEGKYLFKLLIKDSISYICKKNKTNIEKMKISILTNEPSDINKKIIIDLAERVKTINIVTNYIEEFKEVEEYLFNEKGIIVKISNNYKTAMQKTDIIINIDFTEETINKYLIPNKCIIINIKDNIKIKSKKFSGININNYNIIVPKKYQIKEYKDSQVYESYIINKEYKEAMKQIIEDKIQIQNLVGEKGIISNKEFGTIGGKH